MGRETKAKRSMKAKNDPRRSQRLLLFTHTLLWLIGWGFGIYFAADLSSFIPGFVLLIWTLIFIFHCILYLTSADRTDAVDRERQAYRDGFNDALRHLQSQGTPRYEPAHLLEEDAELLEWEAEGKRKRGEQ
jgi:hypothetical protein